MSEKLCLFCRHFQWEAVGISYYSTLTGGDIHGDVRCLAGQSIWSEEGLSLSTVGIEYIGSEADWRRILLTAENCPRYERLEDK